MIWTINFCANITKRQKQIDLQLKPVTDSTVSLVHFQPTLTATQRRQRPQHGTDKMSPPHTAILSVKVWWKIKTVKHALLDDLGSIGKKLCGGAYTQIARSTWSCKKVREQFVLLFLKEINWECFNMCSKKNPNVLRKTCKENIVNFSLTELDNELKDKLVMLHLENIHI